MERNYLTFQKKGCALVTGASRGIGATSAISLARAGWAVGINYRSDREGAMSTAEAITSTGGRAVALRGDVADPEAVDAMFNAVEEQLGPVYVLVNNAGISIDGLLIQLDEETWNQVIQTNLGGAFRTTKRALRCMMRARFGRVINISSVASQRSIPGMASYSASKAGLVGLTKTVAVEIARRGITVNAIAPGFVETDMTSAISRDLMKAAPVRRPGNQRMWRHAFVFLPHGRRLSSLVPC